MPVDGVTKLAVLRRPIVGPVLVAGCCLLNVHSLPAGGPHQARLAVVFG